MSNRTGHATNKLGMRCKPSFYFSPWSFVVASSVGRSSFVVGRWQFHTLSSRAQSRDLVFPLRYRMSRLIAERRNTQGPSTALGMTVCLILANYERPTPND